MNTFDLSDYLLSKLRKKSSLWYDLNEAAWEKQYVNQAQITDGESFLLLWFTSSQPQYDNWLKIDHEIGPLFLAWQNRHDSRLAFDESFFREVSASVANHLTSRYSESHYSLLSFQFAGSSPIGPFEELVSHVFPSGLFQSLPSYSGKLCDSSELTISPDPYAKWFQVSFDAPISVTSLSAGLAELTEGGEITLESNKGYKSSAELRQAGVNHIQVFGRIW